MTETSEGERDERTTGKGRALLDPAATIIRKCGGVAAVARMLGRDYSSVYRWQRSVEDGGHGGKVPSKAKVQLARLALERRIKLSMKEIMGDD